MTTTLLLMTLAFVPRPASADTDARWLPWLGCWQSATERAVSPDARICFVPAPNGGVERIAIMAVARSSPVPDGQPLNADDAEHPIVSPECAGTLRVDWSADGHRYFTSSNRSCIDEVAAKTSSISLLLPGPAWLEAEVVESFGWETVKVHRYRRVAVPESLAARLPADVAAKADAAADSLSTMRLTVAHVIDANSRVNSHALEAMVLESNTPFLLNARGLKALSKARVHEDLIDLMVAVSYPDHFRVDQPSGASGGASGDYAGYAGGTMWDQLPAICWHTYFDPVFCYSSSSFLYYAYNAYERPYYVPPSVIVAPPIQPGPGPTPGVARAINNYGYTRVREADPTPTPSSATNAMRPSTASAQRTAPRPRSTDSGGTASSGSSSSSSSSGSSSSNGSGTSSGSSGGGYSSGGGGDTGRTAVPR